MRLCIPFAKPKSGPRLRDPLPLLTSQVCAGFPSPADDHREGELDLNELLIHNSASTFFVRVAGESMSGGGANILPGDLLVVDRSIEARDKHIVVACINGEFNCKRLRKSNGKVWLESENQNFAKLEITPEQDFEIWGVVVGRISQFI